jgi:hypothetical protein
MPTKTTTTDVPVDLDTARRQLAELEAEAARQRADVEARAVEALAARERRLAEFDATAVDTINDRMQALQAEEAEARKQLRAAVLADPVLSAYTRLSAARTARYHLDNEQANIASRLGRPEHRTAESYSTPSLIDTVMAIVGQEVKMQAADVIDEHTAAREAAGAGPEGTPAPDTTGLEVSEVTTPEGRRVRVTRNLRTGAQTTVDVETGQPYSPPTRRAPVDDGVADGAQLDRRGLAAGDGWARGPAAL